MTPRIMLDIETLGIRDSAVVLSVGAVPWVMNKTGVLFLSPKIWVLSLRDQFARGRTTDDSTIKWWAQQSEAARDHWVHPIGNPVPVEVFAHEFGGMWTKETEAWAHGVLFDLGILASLLGVTPWTYNAVGDARTMAKYPTQLRWRPMTELAAVAHHPLNDCKHQIWNVWEHWPDDDLIAETPEAAVLVNDLARIRPFDEEGEGA